jgi:fermentation-respiration switch protein FrsA (DUF1100 family)
VIAGGIFDASLAVAVVHLPGSVKRFGAGLNCGIVDRVDVADVVVESSEQRLRLGPADIAHLQHGVAESDGSMRDFAAGFLGTNSFLGVKGGFEKVEEPRDAAYDEIRSDVVVAFGYGGERFSHG